MENKKIDFSQTKEALSQLRSDLAVLDSELQVKSARISEERTGYANDIQDKKAKIDSLTQNMKETIAKIDSITGYIDGVL